MQPPSPHDEILADYLSTQRQRDHTLDASSSSSLTPRERMALLKLAYETALNRTASSTIAGVALEDIDTNARICPITFNHGWRVDYYRLLSPSRVHDELLMLWARKMGFVPLDEQQQQAAVLDTLTNVQPIEGMLRKFMDADDAVILPTTEVLQSMAPILEQRLAKAILTGKNGWPLDIDFSKDSLLPLHCTKLPILDDVTPSNASIPNSHKWARPHDFIYIALRRPEEDKQKSLRPSVTSHWKDRATQMHFFHRFISTYPTIIGPELPIFPSFLSLAAAVGVYVFRVKAVRRIEGWEGFFVAHHDVAMYIARLLCAASKASFRRVLKLRPKNLPEKHADVQAFERLPEDDDGDEVVTRGFPCRTDGGASKKHAKEGSNISRAVRPAHKKQKLAECNESEGSSSHNSRSHDSQQRLEPSLSPVKLARLNLARAASRLDHALEELFDARLISLLDLLLGWQAVNAAVGREKARELVDLRLAKLDAFDALREARRVEEEEEEEEVRERGHLRALTPETTCGSSSRSSSSEEPGAGGEGWACLTDD